MTACKYYTAFKGLCLCSHPSQLMLGKFLNQEKTHLITTEYHCNNKCGLVEKRRK